MKKIICLFLCMSFHHLLYSQNYDVLVSDTYDNNEKGWYTVDDKYNLIKVEDSHYFWQRKVASGRTIVYDKNKRLLSPVENYYIEATIERKVEEGDHYVGLAVGKVSNGDQYFVFSVDKNNMAQVFECKNVKDSEGKSKLKYNFLLEETKVDNLGAKNKFSIHQKNGKIDYRINDKLVATIDAIKFKGKFFGFYQWGKGTMRVDDYKVLQDAKELKLVEGFETIGEVERLPMTLNSENLELEPIVAHDGQTLYFVSITDKPDRKDRDIYYSKIDNSGTFASRTNMSALNDKYSNTLISMLPDNNTAYVRGRFINGVRKNGVSKMTKTADGWGNRVAQELPEYNDLGKYIEYSISADGSVMLITPTLEEGYGDKDIYVCFREGDNKWSKPLNLGPHINTWQGECCPFLAADGKTLYFSSNGHTGYGYYDIFVTRRLDDTWTNWSVPENLGDKVNTSNFDAYFIIPAKGDYAYFTRYTKATKEDIYRIKLPAAARPDPIAEIDGHVYDAKTKKPIEAKIIFEDLTAGKEIGFANSDPANGAYKIMLPYGKNYGFRASAEGYFAVSQNLNLSKNEGVHKDVKQNLYLVPIEKGQSIKMNNLFFKTNQHAILSSSYSELNRVANLMKEKTDIKVQIEGHTDNQGDATYNKSLSLKRAEAVKKYLVSKGISASRISVKGFGESKPVASNNTSTGRKQNRRVEFRIL